MSEEIDLDCLAPARWVGFAAGVLMGGLLLVACSDSKPVNYYMNHADERARKVAACLGQGNDSDDCRNARQADFQARGISARDGRAIQP